MILLLMLVTPPLLADSDWTGDDYLYEAPPPGFCCQTASRPREPGLCASNTSCVVADLDGSVSSSDNCLISDDLKFENSFNRLLLNLRSRAIIELFGTGQSRTYLTAWWPTGITRTHLMRETSYPST